jgi:transposase
VSQSPDSLWHRTSARLRYPSPASSATDQLTELKEPANDDQDGSPKESGARAFGHSKDLRTDLPQVVIALAGTRDGVPLRCWTFPGNTADTRSSAPSRTT